MIELSQFEKCVIRGESGKFLIDKGRVLEWTEDRSLATVYFQCDADLKIINWPNTLMIKYPIKNKCSKEIFVSEWATLRKKLIDLNFSVYRLSKNTGISEGSFKRYINTTIIPTQKMELKIKNWLDSL